MFIYIVQHNGECAECIKNLMQILEYKATALFKSFMHFLSQSETILVILIFMINMWAPVFNTTLSCQDPNDSFMCHINSSIQIIDVCQYACNLGKAHGGMLAHTLIPLQSRKCWNLYSSTHVFFSHKLFTFPHLPSCLPVVQRQTDFFLRYTHFVKHMAFPLQSHLSSLIGCRL